MAKKFCIFAGNVLKILETLALALVMLLGMYPTPALAAFVK